LKKTEHLELHWDFHFDDGGLELGEPAGLSRRDKPGGSLRAVGSRNIAEFSGSGHQGTRRREIFPFLTAIAQDFPAGGEIPHGRALFGACSNRRFSHFAALGRSPGLLCPPRIGSRRGVPLL
jgi:hypothetical protein